MRVMRDLVGQTLSGRYRMIARIAGGGMGEIYRAHDLLLDRSVAVKVLQPSLANDPDLVQRFRDEARAAARLSHPNVVAVHDWGSEDENTYFMVMEYVAGTDLRDILVGRGPFEPAHATEVVISLCDALQAAHNRGLVHRDVKPENVLISRNGTVKVADFGIAAIADAERTLPGGNIIGTLRYLAPEQARGEDATAASDIWSAGAVLFELLIGQALPGGTGAELLRRRAVEPPVAPSSIESSIPPELDDIVLRACAVHPDDRFPTAEAMADALRDVLEELGGPAPPVNELLGDVTDEIRLPEAMPTPIAAPSSGRGKARRRSRRGRRRPSPFLLLLIGVLLLAGWAASAAVLGPKEVEVPKLVGLSEDRAAAQAEQAGFETEVVDERRSPAIPAGAIISQDPAGGLLLQGEPIELVVSTGPPLTRVPDVVGDKVKQARSALKEANLDIGRIQRRFSLEHEKGLVMAQKPARDDGRQEWGSTVNLVVSRGPRSIEVPSVNGMDETDARVAVAAAGFEPIVFPVFSDDVKKGKVVYTTPAAGEEAPEGSEVRIAISQGEEKKSFKMPDVVGMKDKAAKSKLLNLGLRTRIQRSCQGGDTVRATDPTRGEKVKEGDRVILFVC